MTLIRAKFRCMSITRKWDDSEIVEFLPVNRGKDKDPENQAFWDATPSGKATLTFNGSCGINPGAYYYVDMAPSEEGLWLLQYVTHYHDCGEVSLGRAWTSVKYGLVTANLTMTISFMETVKRFGEPNSKWDVTFTHAEPNDGEYMPG